MRIAQVSTLFESVPPKRYGGTERVVSTLTEELVARGHEVTVFASGDSETSAELVSAAPRSLRLDGKARDFAAFTMIELAEVFDRESDFDIIHNHADYFAFPFAHHAAIPVLTTAHGRLDLEEVLRVYGFFSDAPLVSISDSQRQPLPDANWVDTIYHGIDFRRYHLRTKPGDYLAFLGRIAPEKRPDRAIEVARTLGMRLKIAAKVDDVDRSYFQQVVRPHLSDPLIEFVGEVTDHEKDEFLGEAFAYLFPIDWPEPFGLTMVESMATGTPVVAMDCGSVPEVIDDGVTGFACKTLRDFIDAVPRAGDLNRARCRQRAEQRFSARVMADQYEAVYRRLIEGRMRRESAA